MRIYARTASPAEPAVALPAIGRDFDIGSWIATNQYEVHGGNGYRRIERRPSQNLAVGAVANSKQGCFDLRFEADLATMALSVDFHFLLAPARWLDDIVAAQT